MNRILNICFIFLCVSGSIRAQRYVPVQNIQDLVLHPDNNDVYDLDVIDDRLLIAGSFDYFGEVTSNNLAWYDGEVFTPFQPPIYGNSVKQIIKTDSSIIVVGHLSQYYGAAELIDSVWVPFGVPGGVNMRKLFRYQNGFVTLRNQIVHQRIDGDWIPLPTPNNLLIKDIVVHEENIYGLTEDQLWYYHNATWDSIATPEFLPKELSAANNLLFCSGRSSINDSTEVVSYVNIVNNLLQPFSFGFTAPNWFGSVAYLNNQWQITDSQDHATFGDPANRSAPMNPCSEPYIDFALLDCVNYQNKNYYAINGEGIRGLYMDSQNNTCPFIETSSIRAYQTANSSILNITSLLRPGLLIKRGLENPVGTIYTSNLWMTGTTAADTIVTAQTFQHISNQTFGPVAEEMNMDFVQRYAAPMHLSKAAIDMHVQSYSNPFYVMPPSIQNWPAHGNVSNGEAALLAPFTDVNQNGLYEPELGDYPSIKGDLCSYTILNDTRSFVDQLEDTTQLLKDSLRIEDHVMMYMFESGSEALQHTVFVEHTLINRSDRTYNDFICGIWNDFDMGSSSDDFIGSDSLRNCFYGYNGDPFDEATFNSYGFGALPYATGCVVLNQRLKAAISYNSGTNPINGNPINAEHYYNYLQGRWKNGSPILFGSNGLSGNQVTSAPCSFMYCSDPGSMDSDDWNESTLQNLAGERRMLGAVKPQQLNPGDRYCLHYAFVSAKAEAASDTAHFESVHRMLNRVDSIQTFYDAHLMACATEANAVISGNGTEENNWFQVYPNPGSDFISLALPYNDLTYTLRVFNDIGQLIVDEILVANDPFMAISTQGWANGFYVVQLSGNGIQEQRKWIKMASR